MENENGSEPLAAGQLRSVLERVERLEEEKDVITSDIKEVYGEAKANGFDVPTLKKLVARRKKDAGKVEEEDALLDLYITVSQGKSQSSVPTNEGENGGTR